MLVMGCEICVACMLRDAVWCCVRVFLPYSLIVWEERVIGDLDSSEVVHYLIASFGLAEEVLCIHTHLPFFSSLLSKVPFIRPYFGPNNLKLFPGQANGPNTQQRWQPAH